MTSLTGSKIAGAQATGFQLALQVAQQSEPLYLQNARTWFNAAFLIVSVRQSRLVIVLLLDNIAELCLDHVPLQRKTPASLDSFSAASEFLLYSFDKARYLPEFAREVANAGAVRKFGEGLLNYAGTEGCDMNVRRRLCTVPASN